jgi:plasmid stabilization system protein ParE
MKVRYTPQAGADIDAIFTYISLKSLQSAPRVKATIQAKVESLADAPFIGRQVRNSRIRVTQAYKLPYLIYYRINVRKAEIAIIHVRHGARKPFTPA